MTKCRNPPKWPFVFRSARKASSGLMLRRPGGSPRRAQATALLVGRTRALDASRPPRPRGAWTSPTRRISRSASPRAPRAVRGFLAGVLSPILRAAAEGVAMAGCSKCRGPPRADAGDASRTSCPRHRARGQGGREVRPARPCAQARGCQRAREAAEVDRRGRRTSATRGRTRRPPRSRRRPRRRPPPARSSPRPPPPSPRNARASCGEDDAHARARRPAPAPAHAQAPTPAPAQAPTPAPAAPRLTFRGNSPPRPGRRAPHASRRAPAPPPPRRRRR